MSFQTKKINCVILLLKLLLDAIYQLGSLQEDDEISCFLTDTSAKHVVGMIFEYKDSNIKYKESRRDELQNPSKYLYKKDTSNQLPGLFLTGEIRYKDIRKIRNTLIKNPEKINSFAVKEFIRKKILSFPNGKLVNEYSGFLNNLEDKKKNEILGIFKEFKLNGEKIAKDVVDILEKDEAETVLLTIMIHRDGDDGPMFVGEREEYREFFKKGILRKKSDLQEQLVCTICNSKSSIGTFSESPFPFYFTKKATFFPEADPCQAMKGVSICDSCYPKIQKGIKFIQDKLNYSIGQSSLNFWLIPHLNDQEIIINFQDDLGKKNLYLNSLKELCSALKTISKQDRYESFHETINVESFLSYSALFYTLERGWMRVFNYKQGIYPSHLQTLFEVKEKVDNQYPFRIISKNFKEKEGAFFVGFPLLIMFYKGIKPQWQSLVISILDKMLTGQQVILDEVIQNIIIKIREVSLKSYNLKLLTRTIFLGLMLLEYLINLNGNQKNDALSQPGDKSITKYLGQDIANIQKFIETHNNILFDGTTRAIFAVGVCVGILIEVQNKRYKTKMAPFWSRLNRLDLDFERIKLLPKDVKSKLAIYNERRYNTIISYLEATEFSDLNIISPNISRENLNLIFSIGLSYGYLLKNELLK